MSDRPDLVQQPHGGALLAGGVPGNAGGTGRPPSAIRGTMRELLDRSLEILARAVETGTMPPAGIETRDFLKAIDIVAKYALKDDPEDERRYTFDVLVELARATDAALRDRLAEYPDIDDIVDAVRRSWLPIVNGSD